MYTAQDQSGYNDLYAQILAILKQQQSAGTSPTPYSNILQAPPPGFVPAGGGGGAGGQATGGSGNSLPVNDTTSTTPPAVNSPFSQTGPSTGSQLPGAGGLLDLTKFSSNPGYLKDYPAALWGGTQHVADQQPPQWIDDLIAKYKANPTAALKDHIFSFSYPDYILKYLQDQIK